MSWNAVAVFRLGPPECDPGSLPDMTSTTSGRWNGNCFLGCENANDGALLSNQDIPKNGDVSSVIETDAGLDVPPSKTKRLSKGLNLRAWLYYLKLQLIRFVFKRARTFSVLSVGCAVRREVVRGIRVTYTYLSPLPGIAAICLRRRDGNVLTTLQPGHRAFETGIHSQSIQGPRRAALPDSCRRVKG